MHTVVIAHKAISPLPPEHLDISGPGAARPEALVGPQARHQAGGRERLQQLLLQLADLLQGLDAQEAVPRKIIFAARAQALVGVVRVPAAWTAWRVEERGDLPLPSTR